MKIDFSIGTKVVSLDIPYSRMKYPDTFSHKLRYFFWVLYTPIHPFGRDLFLRLGLVKHKGRQEFYLGNIDIEKSFEILVKDLIAHGYGNHFVAWEDAGELISLRSSEDFEHQYHIRIFTDGEVRGHYEYTPECHPILHMKEINSENRAQTFLTIIDKHLIKS